MALVVSLVGATALAVTAGAEEVAGLARIVDGDTIEIRGQGIRLLDIDAPETGQTCLDERGEAFPCGAEATRELRRLIAGRTVRCTGTRRGAYGRLLAICRVGATDLNRQMVRRGWAVRYGEPGAKEPRYLAEELDAAKERLGIWRRGPDGFQDPKAFRRDKWAMPPQTAPKGCPIKGNIRGGKRIYHAPWSRDYRKTRIDLAKGERWFCSEAEAVRAGWRAPYR